MTAIYFSTHACHASDLIDGTEAQLEDFKRLNKLGTTGRLSKGQVYTLDFNNPYAPSIVSVLNHLSSQERDWLIKATVQEGEALHQEAAFWEAYLSEEQLSAALSLVGATGPAFQIKSQQLSGFHQALVRYENALLAIQSPAAPGMPGAGARAAEAQRNAIRAYDILITEYRTAMQQLAPAALRARNRGSAINNSQRGITLALRSRGGKIDPRLLVADLFQAHTLKRFTQFMAKGATPLALAADATIRAGKVKSVSQADGDWHRESFRQIGGFAVGAIAGSMVGATTFKLATAAFAGPIGWALLGCIVVVAAGAGYAASVEGGRGGEFLGSLLYDARH